MYKLDELLVTSCDQQPLKLFKWVSLRTFFGFTQFTILLFPYVFVNQLTYLLRFMHAHTAVCFVFLNVIFAFSF